MRRQTTGTDEVLGGASCLERLDPFHLPARVVYGGSARAGAVNSGHKVAIIGRENVMIRRETQAGVPLYVTVPLSEYSGVLLSVRLVAGGPVVELWLHHPIVDLGVPLFEASDTTDIIADWRTWAKTLALPLLIHNADGSISEPHQRIGGVVVNAPQPRRANRFSRR